MTITEGNIKQMLFDDSIVPVLPFMHQLIQELKSRKLSHRAQPGCPACKKEVYIDDLIGKTVCVLSSLDNTDREKFRKFLRAKDDIFLATKENGAIKKTKIA